MEKLSSDTALELLIKDVIHNKKELEIQKNRWVKHCIFVAIAAGRIARKLNLDEDYANALGYIHDIGRKISHNNHPVLGYKYMIENGYEEDARSCLTHSFIDNDINLTAGPLPTDEAYEIISEYLANTELTIYDNIIQMCDLFCLETGFTTVERRLLDITKRKGVYPHSLKHFESALALKERLESQMGCSLYSLFPEIKPEILAAAESDRQKLIELLQSPELMKPEEPNSSGKALK